jgi:hypothetical protein
MNPLKFGVDVPTFTATCNLEGRSLTAELTGTADLIVRERVDNFLGQLQEEAARQRIKEVVMDLRKLEFMNSSCFKSFVSWINTVQEQPSESQYRIRLLSNPQLLWQRRSMHALKCFAVDLIDLET